MHRPTSIIDIAGAKILGYLRKKNTQHRSTNSYHDWQVKLAYTSIYKDIIVTQGLFCKWLVHNLQNKCHGLQQKLLVCCRSSLIAFGRNMIKMLFLRYPLLYARFSTHWSHLHCKHQLNHLADTSLSIWVSVLHSRVNCYYLLMHKNMLGPLVFKP